MLKNTMRNLPIGFGEDAFFSVLEFARKCKNYVPEVVLTVVDIPDIDIQKSHPIWQTS